MHQILFQLGLRPRPRCRGSLQRSPRPLAGFKGILLREGRRGEGRERERRGRKGKGRERKGRKCRVPPPTFE